MTRKEILQNYSVKVTCEEDVERLNELERESNEINYVGKGDWCWTSDGNYYVGTKDSENCDYDKESWGKTFNSVDEFEQFLKAEEPEKSEPKFKVGDKVRIVARGYNHEIPIGNEQKIICVKFRKTEDIYIYQTDYRITPWITDSCAELIEEPEKQESYREYKGIKFPTDVDEFLENGPYPHIALSDYLFSADEMGGMPGPQYRELREKFDSNSLGILYSSLENYWYSKKKKVELPFTAKELMENGPFDVSDEELMNHINGNMSFTEYTKLGIKGLDYPSRLMAYWMAKRSDYEWIASATSGEGIISMIRKEVPSINPLSKLTCKSKSKSLDLKPKKINEVKLNIKK